MSKRKNIEKELEKFVSVYESGGGFGDPEAKAEHERKFQLLMHKQLTVVNNRNSNITIINVLIAFVNIGILIYQVFFK
ncbi:MAG: hypothetical protein HOG49_04820 [Candidatus Scalindua sp.]|jgi:hypothetical protein|nr:hypothetical protein [Candidatus Scalindua sp.]